MVIALTMIERIYCMENNSIPSLQDRKVVEHNDLILSIAKMNKIPLKMFELAVSQIDVDNPPKDNIVYVSKSLLFSFFGVSDNHRYARFKQVILDMQKHAFFEIKEVKGNKNRFTSIVPIPTVSWNEYDDIVTFEFNRHIMPYLVDLKANFTQYTITDIMGLESKYSIIIYKWLTMNYNQYEHYEHTKTRTAKQLDELKNPTITLQELRTITDTLNEYDRFERFDNRVLKIAVKEISEHTHFNISYEKIRKGRSIHSIQFRIKKKKVIDVPYKEIQQDPEYILDKTLSDAQKLQLNQKALTSPYTNILMSNELLEFTDLADVELMISLLESVYIYYDELKQSKGEEAVHEHIRYVKKHQKGYSKVNKAKYLRVAIMNYLKE